MPKMTILENIEFISRPSTVGKSSNQALIIRQFFGQNTHANFPPKALQVLQLLILTATM